jgi:hypothetical protein
VRIWRRQNRQALERDGYVLVKCEHAVFNPEASWLLPVLGELCYLQIS